MKINPIRPGVISAYANQAKKHAPNQKKVNNQGDKLEISQQAQEINKYRAELKKLPAIRTDKVNDIKTRIKNGTYQPSAQQIAEGMLKERHLDKLV